MRFIQAWGGLCLGVVAFATHAAPGSPRLHILTTLAPLYSWTANVAGDLAEVENLLPADVGPHEFQFRPRDLKKIQGADLVILNGLGVETWLEKTFRHNAATNGAPQLVRTSDGLEAEFIYHSPTLVLDMTGAPKPQDSHLDPTHSRSRASGPPNPHIWLDPTYARHGVSNILAALCNRDPVQAAAYTAHAAAYLKQLDALDADFRALSAALPNKAMVTFHDAFPYFARRYGFDLVGVVEEIPSVGPSPKYLSQLTRVIKTRNVRFIFTEPQYEPRLVRQLSQDLNIEFTELDVLETGRPTAEFYIEGMRRNLRTLAAALK